MQPCRVCHFEPVPDDVAVQGTDGFVVCLACYGDLTETRLLLPKELRRELEAILADLPLGSGTHG